MVTGRTADKRAFRSLSAVIRIPACRSRDRIRRSDEGRGRAIPHHGHYPTTQPNPPRFHREAAPLLWSGLVPYYKSRQETVRTGTILKLTSEKNPQRRRRGRAARCASEGDT